MKLRRWLAAGSIMTLGLLATPVPAYADTGVGTIAGVGDTMSQSGDTTTLDATLDFDTDNPGVQFHGRVTVTISHFGANATVHIEGGVPGVLYISATCTGTVNYTPPTFSASLRCNATITTPFGTVTVTLCIEISGFAFISISGPPFKIVLKGRLTIAGC